MTIKHYDEDPRTEEQKVADDEMRRKTEKKWAMDMIEIVREKLQRAADGLDTAGDPSSSRWCENMAEDLEKALKLLNGDSDEKGTRREAP